MNLCQDGLEMLKETSRTFYIPISRLPAGLKEAVASAYLCMRAIDDIEDHAELDGKTKAKLLKAISSTLQASDGQINLDDFAIALSSHQSVLPEVSLRVGEWASLAPASIAPRIWDATAAMSDRMADWAVDNWTIKTEGDLNRYTFSVAGAVGLMLSDLWAWYDGTPTNRTEAIGFGRGLQAVNILRNHTDDLSRGVEFFPVGWGNKEMHAYARRNLVLADAYTKMLPAGAALEFCKIPLALAHATLDVMALGQAKLSRSQVMALTEQ